MTSAFSLPALEQDVQGENGSRVSHQGDKGHRLSSMSWAQRVTHILKMEERAERLTEAIWSLEEPWRSRFLVFLTSQATNYARDGRSPEPEEVMTWLSDQRLYRMIASMMDVWRDEWRCTAA